MGKQRRENKKLGNKRLDATEKASSEKNEKSLALAVICSARSHGTEEGKSASVIGKRLLDFLIVLPHGSIAG